MMKWIDIVIALGWVILTLVLCHMVDLRELPVVAIVWLVLTGVIWYVLDIYGH